MSPAEQFVVGGVLSAVGMFAALGFGLWFGKVMEKRRTAKTTDG